MTELGVAQAVYTDPGGVAAGGYVLAATSRGVRHEEADFLSHSPGISEYLHSHESPGPFLSFFKLPTGRWGLVRRFVAGERKVRGYHRVVVHMLVMPEALLAAVEGDAWLLASSKTCYRDAQGRVLTLAELGLLAANPGIETLDDLGCTLPKDPRRQSLELLEDCCSFLREALGGEYLEQSLAWIFDALWRRRRVLLPQGLEPEQLLSLVTASLPSRDRLHAPWTTHFAAGVRVRFRIANAPDPEAAVMLHRQVDEWRVLPEVHRAGEWSRGPGADLARVLVAGGETWSQVADGFHRYGLSLLEDGEQLGRWVAYRFSDLDSLYGGCTELGDLRQLLRRTLLGWRRPSRDPWLDPAMLLHGVCITAREALAAERSVRDLAGQVHHAVAAEEWAGDLFTPGVLGRMFDLPASRQDPFIFFLAIVMVKLQLPEPPAATEEREQLFGYLRRLPLTRLVEERPNATAWLLAELGIELARCGSSRFGQIFALAASVHSALEKICGSLRTGNEDLPASFALLGVALDHEEPDIADAVTSRLVIPTLAATPQAAPSDLTLLERSLDHLRHRPQWLASALGTWRGELLELALATLRKWLEGAPSSSLRCRS